LGGYPICAPKTANAVLKSMFLERNSVFSPFPSFFPDLI
jgi:hypothetical protein